MKIYLDTANEDFYLLVMNDKNEKIYSKHLPDYTKKVSLIPEYFKKSKINLNDVKSFYLNLGPGFFTGVRIGLVFVRTIALLTNANIYTTSTFEILKLQNPESKSFSLSSGGQKIFEYKNLGEFSLSKITIKEGKTTNKINYQDIENNFSSYGIIFKLEKDIMNIEPYYIKMPQIGNKK